MKTLNDISICHFRNSLNQRCYNPKNKSYRLYGGRGIENFLTKEEIIFLWKRDNADNLKRPCIDRIDPSGNYELSNCRFIELSENAARVIHFAIDDEFN